MPTLYIKLTENMFYCLNIKMMQWLQVRIVVKRTFSGISYINTRNETLVSYAVEATNLKKFVQSESKDNRGGGSNALVIVPVINHSTTRISVQFLNWILLCRCYFSLFLSVLDQTLD